MRLLIDTNVVLDGLVTRNPGDYAESELSVWTPEEVIKLNTDK